MTLSTSASTATPKPAGMRQMNERIVLQAVRVYGPLPKSEIARLTQLSTQTTSLIVDRLIDDGLLAREARTRVQGRMGQPSVPISLRADGAFSIGVKVGRRSLDVLTMDFAGQVHARDVIEYAYPDPRTVFALLSGKIDQMMATLGENAMKVVGIGVAAPLWLGGWRNFFDTPPDVFAAWNEIDISARVQALTTLPVEFAKDTTAACAAELLMGQGRGLGNFLYVFIGTFTGGGLVIDGRLHAGPKGNASAIGSFPLMSEGTPQLLNVASIYVLEKRFTDAGFLAAAAHDQRALSAQLWPMCEAWLDAACPALATAIATAAALVDVDVIVIDGELDRQLLREVLTRTNTALDAFDWRGMVRPRLVEGEIGADARAMGGAILPLYAHFAPRHVLFLKSGLNA
ncbi:MAG: Transcriptional regulator FrcR for fructose utilization, ROK family [uncultured Caballeronia sp.]|nr:MAG: Transcriptional regulator FrcR for fructose utilization, ROK family [uncultured Caballeronia sp.]